MRIYGWKMSVVASVVGPTFIAKIQGVSWKRLASEVLKVDGLFQANEQHRVQLVLGLRFTADVASEASPVSSSHEGCR